MTAIIQTTRVIRIARLGQRVGIVHHVISVADKNRYSTDGQISPAPPSGRDFQRSLATAALIA